MHDPLTVAFEIRRPWRNKPCKLFAKGYRPSMITIWHKDPERDAGKRGLRRDDTCGWFDVPTTPEERERIRKMGEQEYSTLFRWRQASQEGASYVEVCYEPSAYDAIYWAWRQIKYEGSRYRWKFGRIRNPLTKGELAEIYSLASCPVDNLRLTVAMVNSAEKCGFFFRDVHRAYLRYHRPWWKHPQWHFWHWRIQVHAWQKFRRWAFDRCAECGGRFGYGETPIGTWSGDRIWHERCSIAKPPSTGGTQL